MSLVTDNQSSSHLLLRELLLKTMRNTMLPLKLPLELKAVLSLHSSFLINL